VTSEEDKRWLRALPLLLAASLLLMAGALAFYRAGDNTASTAAFTAGLILLGAWGTTAIVDWYRQRPPRP
jgi:predicted membrane protein